MRIGINFLIICLMLVSSLTFEPVISITPLFMGDIINPKERVERKMSVKIAQELLSVNESLRTLVHFGKKIHSISEYSESEKQLALLKFLEIHDELLNSYFSDDVHMTDSMLRTLLKMLNNNMKQSVLTTSPKMLDLMENGK